MQFPRASLHLRFQVVAGLDQRIGHVIEGMAQPPQFIDVATRRALREIAGGNAVGHLGQLLNRA